MNKAVKLTVSAVFLALFITAAALSGGEAPTGQIYLYGEAHGVDEIIEKEYELWYDYYHNHGMRHLFVEGGHGAAELLNIWMKSDSDEFLDLHFMYTRGTAGNVPASIDFYKRIKAECPETVFHGTDVEHQYQTNGARYLQYLEDTGMKNTDSYALAVEMNEQAEQYYIERRDPSSPFRENMMVQNFMREFDKLNGESVMGIYGAAHTSTYEIADGTEDTPTMASALKEKYGEAVHTVDLTKLAEPLSTEILTIGGKDYTASYFGEERTSARSLVYQSLEFWRLEDAYDDFKDNSKTGDGMPYSHYPMPIEDGQVLIVDFTTKAGDIRRIFYISDGFVWENSLFTVGIEIAETGTDEP